MKSLIAAGLLFLATSAHAAPPSHMTTMEYCNFITSYAEALAFDRDNGTDRWHAYAILANDPQIPMSVKLDLKFLIDEIHNRPHHTPQEEGRIMFNTCWIAYGDRASLNGYSTN